IRKPIAPRELAAKLESMVEVVGESDESPVGDSLPVDARDRVDLILALVAASQPPRHKPNVEVLDDGVFVTVTATLDEDDPALHADLLQICSDVRCLDRGGKPVLEARFFLDGRRAESDLSVDPSEDWPAGDAPIAVDFGRGDPCPPARAAEILHMASNASSLGRLVYFTNLPGHLRLYLEVFGNAAAMPIRGLAGPALPEALAELWR
ncbi:MAG: hypothetical protein KDC87_13020, partial [Planctomycetes bacterium]|nr:hypothetical protein [Planctomycetota bacterium]